MLLNSKYDSGMPLGTVLQGWGLDPVLWQQLDGRTLTRSAWPYLSERFPIGKHTGTVRTLPSNAATSGPVIATANHFVAPGPSGVLSILYSTDGVTWSAATTPSHTPAAVCAMAARLVTLNGAAAQGIASATLDPTSAWSVVSGGPTGVTLANHISRMAYSPTLGRMLVVVSTRYTMDDASTAYTSRASTTGLSTPIGVCWTGTRFILIFASNSACEFSNDGITYTAGLLVEALSSAQGNIASDGAGTVVVSGSPSGLQVSKDHGATFQLRQIPGVAPSDAWRVQRAGDRFVVPTVLGLAFSLDGENWQLEPTSVQALSIGGGVARKGTVTVQVVGSNTTAYSFTESSTEFQLPNLRQVVPAASGNPIPQPAYFIKGA